MNKDDFYLLQNNTSKDYNVNIYKIINIFFKTAVTKASNANINIYK